jgi:hypothetical protein
VETNTVIDFLIFTSPTLEELVAKIFHECLKPAEGDEPVKQCGYKLMDYYE